MDAYPPSKFFSDEFINSHDSNGKFYTPTLLGPGFVAALLGFGWTTSGVMVATGVLTLWSADYIHTGLHLRDFWMDKFALFRELRRLHVFHHKGDFRVNYGVFDFTFDLAYGSFRLV